MSILHAIVLGIVQGLTEFLPISSSGHLEIVPWLFKWNDYDSQATAKAFDTALHLGTLIAVFIYLRRELVIYLRSGLQLALRRQSSSPVIGRQAWFLVASAIPAGIVGAVFEDVSLIVFGLLLVWADRRATVAQSSRDVTNLSLRDALIIGTAQVLALNPGTSRSGITITAARLSGYSRDAAARLSFLMSVPIIGGAVVFKLAQLWRDGIPEGLGVPMLVGIVSAGISGWIAMWSMIRL
ncbi:MAG: undecaprenyl-diphosphate phosphatase, partial [Acidimicrobiia bacterium]|nr:undecaprenyl-diphosphate phosphatase [Acidimicrobiia bacterium]